MKKLFKILFFSLICFTFFSCESTKVEQDSKSPKNTKNISDIKTPVEQEKLRFTDWKYKGFGNELPLWVEYAVDSKDDAIKLIAEELGNVSEIRIIIMHGKNLDQAEQGIKKIIQYKMEDDAEFESTYLLYDNFWVRDNTKESERYSFPYTSIYVYYKKNIEETGDF